MLGCKALASFHLLSYPAKCFNDLMFLLRHILLPSYKTNSSENAAHVFLPKRWSLIRGGGPRLDKGEVVS